MIRIRHGEKYYNKGKSNELHVMDDINLELPSAGLVAIFGPSGCGKTTLLNVVGGLDNPDSGEILLDGQNLRSKTDLLRNQYIGYIFQNYNLCKNETVYDNVADALRICGVRDEEEIRIRVEIALKNVGMEKFRRRLPDNLSGGQQQRVAIARALVKNPRIILADEPTGNLDEINTLMVMDILKEISKDHLVLLVTHEADLADYYCDQVVDVSDGKIVGIRENADANGYVCRNKNHVYLGELPKETHELPGVELECFGEFTTPVKLRIVSVEGRIYLKCDTSEVKVLDDSSEVKLLPGSFVEKRAKGNHDGEGAMIPIPPIEGRDYGKLFTFKEAVKLGFRENFTKGRKKKRRLLRLCMIMMACVVVFMAAIASVSLKKLMNLHKEHKENVFFIALTDTTDGSLVSEHIGEHGLLYARVIQYSYKDFNEYIRFRGGNFMTAVTSEMTSSGLIQNIAWADDLKLVCGTKEHLGGRDMVITTALADEMIESSGVSFLRDYEDLIGMVSTASYEGDGYLRIVGVVESSDKYYYMDEYEATHQILKQVYYDVAESIAPASKTGLYKGELAPGQVALFGGDSKKTIRIFGKDYQVVYQEGTGGQSKNDTYAQWLESEKGIVLPTMEEYIADGKEKNPESDEMQLAFRWIFDLYQPNLLEFCERSNNVTLDEYIYAMYGGDLGELLAFAVVDAQPLLTKEQIYLGAMYLNEKGTVPTQEEINQYALDYPEVEEYLNRQRDMLRDDYAYQYEMQIENEKRAYKVVMNDQDYLKLSYQTGSCDVGHVSYDYYEEAGEDGFEFNYYSHYLMVGSDDVSETREYLSKAYGKRLITPEQVYEEKKEDARVDLLGSSITLIVVLIIISLCIFFIMRSALMNRVKEIGIYRAIGVSKKNIIFRFMVESMILATFTLLIGYLGASWLVGRLTASAVTSSFLYYPWWLAVIVLALIYGLTVLFGTLPATLLLRKTPSEILSKYDI